MHASGQGRHVWLVVVGLLLAAQATGQDFTISTIAGGAPPPTPAVATASAISGPLGVAADAAGNVYFMTWNHCVFKRDTAGVLTVIAGNSRAGFSGDGGPAVAAQLNYGGEHRLVAGLAVDGAGYVYIADTNNQRIRRVSPSGTITTIAGTGEPGFSGDGGPATAAKLRNPTGVAVDGAGNLYIADAGNNRIRRVSASGIITTAPGTQGQQASVDMLCTAVDAAGNIYISDYGTVRRVTPSGVVTPISDSLFNPSGIAVDNAGSLYIADTNHFRVRRHPTTPIPGGIYTVAGTGDTGFSGDGGLATSARLGYPVGVATDAAGNLYIADRNNFRIRRVSSPTPFGGGIIETVAGNGVDRYSGDGGPAISAQINVTDIAVDAAGALYLAEPANHRVRRVSSSGIITTVVGTGTAGYAGDGGPASSAQLNYPAAVMLDAAGNLYIADSRNHCVRRVSTGGVVSTMAGNGTEGFSGDGGPATSAQLADPYGLAFDAGGNLYIADASSQRIRRVSTSGIITTVAGTGRQGYSGDGGPATSAQLNIPTALVTDAVGNLYVADTWNRRVRRVSASGTITTVAGTGEQGYSGDGGPAVSAKLGVVDGVTLDAAGNLYIADRENRIRRVSPAGIITTVAGTGVAAYSGDGGVATAAELMWLDRLTADAAGRIFLSTGNAVRVLTPSCAASATPAALTAPVGGGALTLTIQAGGGCGWQIIGLPAWISASAISGSGPAVVTLTAAANPGAARSATITAAGTAVTISQAAAGGACTYSISPASQRFGAGGGGGVVTVSATPGCSWAAASPVSWVGITSGANGTGDGVVNYYVHPSSSGAARSITLTVAGLPFTIEQLTGLAPAGTMPQVASGGGWRTTFTLVNNGSSAAMARLAFTADDGTKLTLPLTFPQTGTGPIQAGIIEPVLDPGATLIVASEAPAAEPVKQGWAELSTDGAVSGFAVFCQRGGATEQEAVVPLETRAAGGYLLAFDNTGGVETGVAVANLSSQPATVSVTINDDRGAQIQTSPLNLPARGHTAFALSSVYPATARRRGTIEFRRPAGGDISVIGLRFNPTASFTTIPVMTK